MTALARLSDESEWGLTRIEYALRDRQRVRDKQRKRRAEYLQKVAVRERNEKGQFVGPEPVDNPTIWRLKGEDIQELGIIAVRGSTKHYTNGTRGGRIGETETVVSLPFVSILHGSRLEAETP
jgi:hypothetical protein